MTEQETIEKSETYEFGDFRVSESLKAVFKADEPVEIQRRAFDLLIFLIQERHRTVSKDELQETVWPGTIVTEAALTRAVMKARKALDDDANTQQYIKTVHGQGYRFVGEVRLVEPSAATESAIDAQERRRSLLRVATTYGAGAWLINQAAAMVWEAFEWDRWPQQALLGISLIGFPLVLLFAWFYQATPGGLVLRSELPSRGRLKSQEGWGGVQGWTIGVLGLALVLSLAWNFRDTTAVNEETVTRIGVLPVVNATENPELDWVRLGMMSLLNTQLTGVDLPTVPAASMLNSANGADGNEPPILDAETVELLARTEGLKMVVGVALYQRGGDYEAQGYYADDGQTFDLPVFTAPTPAGAVRRLGQHLIQTLKPEAPGDVAMPSTGDVFVDQAFARGMHELLSGNLGRAKDLLEVAANADADNFWANYELSVVMRNLGDLEGAQTRNLRLLEDAKAKEDDLAIAMLSNELGVINDLTGDLDQSQRHYEEGLAAAVRGEHHKRRAVLLINSAILERARANPLAARELLGQALTAYNDAGIELIPGDFFITIGNTYADAGDYEGALAQYRQGLANFRAMQRARGEGIALSNLSWASAQLGDLEASLAYLEESEDLRERIGDAPGLIKSKMRRANLYWSMGRVADMDVLADEVLASDYAQTELEIYATALNFKAHYAAESGQHDEAKRLYEDALALDREGGRIYGQVRAMLGVARTLMAQDKLTEADAMLQTVANTIEVGQLPNFTLERNRLAAEIKLASGEEAQAVAELRAVVDAARQASNDVMLAQAATTLSQVYRNRVDLSQVESWVGIALEAQPKDGLVQIEAAYLAAMKGDTAKVRAHYEAAKEALGERETARLQNLAQVVGNLDG